MSAKEKNDEVKSPERKPHFCLHHGMLAAMLSAGWSSKEDKRALHASDLVQLKL